MVRRAFTLVELLVVIAIIAILTGVILPSLGNARESARAVVCVQRCRELGMATIFYASDHKDRIWPIVLNPQRQQRYTWARVYDESADRFTPGPIWDYLEGADNVLECPTSRRQSINGGGSTDLFDFRSNELDFDFTMISGMQGARIDLERPVFYLDRTKDVPHAGRGRVRYPRSVGRAFLTRFRSTPVFVEESLFFYNDEYRDGLFGNLDQVAARHNNGGNYVMVDGSVGQFKDVSGAAEDLEEAGSDFVAAEIYALLPLRNNGSGGIFFRSVYHADTGEHGFIDRAKLR
ncbi:MAG: type II secretion system protein [Phycisphaerales bacterium]